MPPNAPKKSAQVRSKHRLPELADYSDQVTDADFKRIKDLVPESEYKDAEEADGPAW